MLVVVKEKKNLKRSDDADLCFCRQISVLKAKLNEALSMPAGKQKLQYEVSATCLVDVLHVASVHVFVSSFVAHMFAVSTLLSHLLLPKCSLWGMPVSVSFSCLVTHTILCGWWGVQIQ